MANASLFNMMTDIARTLPGTRLAVGGNAALMAKHLLQRGVQVLLGAQMSESLRLQISPNVEVAGNEIDEDDIHLIIEYKRGDKWGEYEAPRANRFIIHSDNQNPMMQSFEKFDSMLQTFSPHLVIVSGFHMMDNFPFKPGQQQQRLDVVADILSRVPLRTHVHFEMASFSQAESLQDIVNSVVRYADSIGMNEQELPNLLSILSNGSITTVADAYPRVATTLDQMRRVFLLLRKLTEGVVGVRRVTRLHVHTLAFQAVFIVENDDTSPSWKNIGSAAAQASLTASRCTCGNDGVTVSQSRLLLDDSFSLGIERGSHRMRFEPEQPVTYWDEVIDGQIKMKICVAPVLVCTDVVQTVGCGDNISSAGLLIQL